MNGQIWTYLISAPLVLLWYVALPVAIIIFLLRRKK